MANCAFIKKAVDERLLSTFCMKTSLRGFPSFPISIPFIPSLGISHSSGKTPTTSSHEKFSRVALISSDTWQAGKCPYPKDVCILISRTFTGKRDFVDVIQLRILRWGDDPGLSVLAHGHHQGPSKSKREAGESLSGWYEIRKPRTAVVGFDAGRVPHIKEDEQPLEVGKCMETDYQFPEGMHLC